MKTLMGLGIGIALVVNAFWEWLVKAWNPYAQYDYSNTVIGYCTKCGKAVTYAEGWSRVWGLCFGCELNFKIALISSAHRREVHRLAVEHLKGEALQPEVQAEVKRIRCHYNWD